MAEQLTIRVEGLREAIDRLSVEKIGVPLRRLLERAGIGAASAAKQHAPVDTGRYRASIAHELDDGNPPAWAIVGSNVEYAPSIEFGSRPHFPPVSALAVWAQRHGGIPPFLVARAISRRGTKAHKPLQKGLDDVAGRLRGWAHEAEQEIKRALEGG